MLHQTIYDFVTLAIRFGKYTEMDRIYLTNRVLGLIGEDDLSGEFEIKASGLSSVELLKELTNSARANGVIGDGLAEKEILEGHLMDLLTPAPSVVNAIFAEKYARDPKEATEYFFELSQMNDYIKTEAIAKNIVFPAITEYGELEITINLSKPEKDPKEIAAQKNQPSVHYPKCMLCMENEGYEGRLNYPARTNHRIIRMDLGDESWGFQYSPYAYYNEHSIFLSTTHRPMKISRTTYERLLDIVDALPHYFVGSNADLPIVGGSILSHDHYQAGRHTFAMAKAPMEMTFELEGFADVNAGTVKWPMSVIRLQSKDRTQLVEASEFVFKNWQNYSDETVEIRAYSEDGTPHHTVTPIVRRHEDLYEIDLVLRDNNVSDEHPDGIFHPHRDVQHIKKENIGLIEVMGLAVLPPRLATELVEVEKFLLDQPNEMADYHQEWAEMIKSTKSFTAENVKQVVQKEVGTVFARVLEDAGVFKRDENGQQAFTRFIDTLKGN